MRCAKSVCGILNPLVMAAFDGIDAGKESYDRRAKNHVNDERWEFISLGQCR
jgi:hypothetical protein